MKDVSLSWITGSPSGDNSISNWPSGPRNFAFIDRRPSANLRSILVDLGIPEDSIHLRGSLLYSKPRPDSDLDISIVGKATFATFLEVIEEATGVKIMPDAEIKRNVGILSGICPLSEDELVLHVSRRKTKLHFEGIPVSVKCVRSNDEVERDFAHFSSIQATNVGEAIIHGVVTDASASCCYPVEFGVEAIDAEEHQISTILCFESLFAEFLLPGESFEARGVVQEVRLGKNPPNYRLILGTRELAGKEYLRRKCAR